VRRPQHGVGLFVLDDGRTLPVRRDDTDGRSSQRPTPNDRVELEDAESGPVVSGVNRL
jgi:hypothetical protein